MDPVEVDVNSIKYYDAEGNEITTGDGTTDTNSGGIFGNILGSIPGILSALFPSGIGGSSNNTPTVQTLPNGNTSVNLAGNNNTIIIIALIGMVGFLLLTGRQPIQPAKK